MSENQFPESGLFTLTYGKDIKGLLGTRGENIIGQFSGYALRLAGERGVPFDAVPAIQIERESGTKFLKAVVDGLIIKAAQPDALVRMAARPLEVRYGEKFQLVGLEKLDA